MRGESGRDGAGTKTDAVRRFLSSGAGSLAGLACRARRARPAKGAAVERPPTRRRVVSAHADLMALNEEGVTVGKLVQREDAKANLPVHYPEHAPLSPFHLRRALGRACNSQKALPQSRW